MNTSNNSAAQSPDSQEFLVFSLGKEEYAVDILKVQEIRSYDNVTQIPNSPPFIKGVTNLRGNIVPIVDLRIKFNLENTTYDTQTVVIVVNVKNRVIGMVVDSVSDVMTLPLEMMQDSPEMVTSMDSNFIKGLASVSDRMLVIIDIDLLLTAEEMASQVLQ